MDLRYPIGPFKREGTPGSEEIQRAIDDIAEAPAKFRAAVEGLTPDQLDTPYRPDGRSSLQVDMACRVDLVLSLQLRLET